jgi:hypothetical protein
MRHAVSAETLSVQVTRGAISLKSQSSSSHVGDEKEGRGKLHDVERCERMILKDEEDHINEDLLVNL